MLNHIKQGRLLAIAFLLSGCSSPTMYYWGSYQPTVYEYYEADRSSSAEQISRLLKNIEKAKAKNQAVPPGMYAHLGLLYVSEGTINKAFEQFHTEKQLFPESAPFMDFLIKPKGVE